MVFEHFLIFIEEYIFIIELIKSIAMQLFFWVSSTFNGFLPLLSVMKDGCWSLLFGEHHLLFCFEQKSIFNNPNCTVNLILPVYNCYELYLACKYLPWGYPCTLVYLLYILWRAVTKLGFVSNFVTVGWRERSISVIWVLILFSGTIFSCIGECLDCALFHISLDL